MEGTVGLRALESRAANGRDAPDVERHPAAERRQPDHQHQVQLIYIYIDREARQSIGA